MTLRQLFLVFVTLTFSACALFDESTSKKPATTSLIATPPSYYSTSKAKYLGSKYKDNLDRLVERIGRNPKTSTLQFANNISSVGGIGFFTHSATKSPDERYLEVVLATPETFETKGEVSEKVQQLFSRYGAELLGILSSDGEIYGDRELTGYGLNLAWRNVVTQPTGNRQTMARAIVYLSKERALNFVRNDIKQSDLLSEAVIFAVDEDGPLNLVSYKPQELRQEIRPAIREDDLTNVPVAASPATSTKAAAQKSDQKVEVAKRDVGPIGGKSTSQESKVETKKVVAGAQKAPAKAPAPVEASLKEAPRMSSPPAPNTVEPVAANQDESVTPAMEAEVEAQSFSVETATATPSTATASTTRDPAPQASMVQREPSIEQSPEIIVAPAKAATPKSVTPALSAETVRAPKVETAKAAPRQPVPPVVAEPLKVTGGATEVPASAAIVQPVAQRPAAEPQKTEEKTVTAPTVVATNEISPAPRRVELVPLAPSETDAPVQTTEAGEKTSPIVKAPEPARSAQPTVTSPVITPAQKSLDSTLIPSVQAKAAPAEKAGNLPAPESIPPPTPVAPVAVQATSKSIQTPPAPSIARVEPQPVGVKPAAPIATAEPKKLATERPVKEQVALVNKPIEAIPEKTPVAKSIVQTTAEPVKSVTAPVTARPDKESIDAKPSAPPPLARTKETVVEKPVNEQIALLTKPTEPAVERRPVAPPVQKALEGFIIQLAFNDRNKARQWAESMERRGYAVSVTEAGTEGALRVRLGNFSVRDDAERQLRTFNKDGLSGIVINLPQAFRPEARSTVP